MEHLRARHLFPDQPRPLICAPDCKLFPRVCLHQRPDTGAPCPDHLIIPLRGLALAYRKRLREFRGVWAERRFEVQDGIIPWSPAAVERDQHPPAEGDAGDDPVVSEHLCPPAGLSPPVEEAALGDGVVDLQFGRVSQEFKVAGEQARVAPAPLVDEFPESPVLDCLSDAGDLCEGDVEVVEGEQPLPVF